MLCAKGAPYIGIGVGCTKGHEMIAGKLRQMYFARYDKQGMLLDVMHIMWSKKSVSLTILRCVIG